MTMKRHHDDEKEIFLQYMRWSVSSLNHGQLLTWAQRLENSSVESLVPVPGISLHSAIGRHKIKAKFFSLESCCSKDTSRCSRSTGYIFAQQLRVTRSRTIADVKLPPAARISVQQLSIPPQRCK